LRLHEDYAWPYAEALAWMQRAADDVRAGGEPRLAVGSHSADVITLGRHAPESALLQRAALEARGVEVHRVERGGGATVHGPGQIMLYPVVDVRALGLSIPAFTDVLNQTMIAALAELGIEAVADVHGPGVYVGDAKIGSVGFRVERGVVTHGLALNVENDLTVFGLIEVCGRREAAVTSVSEIQPETILDEVGPLVVHHFRKRCVLP
jgi:lipoyl(octanoyl) transferase